MKKKNGWISLVWTLAILAVFFVWPPTAGAAGTPYTVQPADTLEAIQAQVDAGNSLVFPAGTYAYAGTLTIGAGQDITITTENEASVTLKPAAGKAGITVKADNVNLRYGRITFAGGGTITVDCSNSTSGSSRGINCAGYFNLTGGTLNVLNSPGYGIGGDAEGKIFSMTGGTLNVTHCGWNGDEGGFIWSNDRDPANACFFTAGVLNITDCGKSMFGSFYVQTPVTFGSNDENAAPMTVNLENAAASAVENTIFTNKTLTVKKSAAVNITLTGSNGMRRGINTDGADMIIDGGLFKVTNQYAGDEKTYGIRGANIIVENGGKLDVEGTVCGVSIRSSGSLAVSGNSLVTINTTGKDCKDSYELKNTITGSSVKMQDEYSIVNGQKVASDSDKVWKTPVNASGEPLTRFDLPGMAGKSIAIAADPDDAAAHPAYSYSIGADHGGTAYVWAPEVKVNFWPSETAYQSGNAAEIIRTDSTIRGSTIGFVGGAAPALPGGPRVSDGTAPCWIDAATGKAFDPSAAVLRDTDVYIGSAYLIPIDLLEGTSFDSSGGSYINGPVKASAGDKVYYKATIDMSPIAGFVRKFYNHSMGYLDGEYTISLRCSDALTPVLNSPGTNITDYFQGPAVELFTMDGAPAVNGNTVTFKIKGSDKYGPNGTAIEGSKLAELLDGGMWALSNADSYAAVGQISGPGYGRITASFSGWVGFGSANAVKINQVSMPLVLNMIGFQKPNDASGTYADPALGTVGSDPADAVSATVLKKAEPAPASYNPGPAFNRTEHMAYIIGYRDGRVHPEGQITRAETATIFFRLMTDESRTRFWKTTNPFSDVSDRLWYNNAVSTMANASFLLGYTDGTFGGDRPITRAEFAAIAARAYGSDGKYTGADKFRDISGHWAAGYINDAAELGLVAGYGDVTFHPNAYITRAEAMTLVNRFLTRDRVDLDSLMTGMITWPDNQSLTAWYYCAVQEATNSHDYTRRADGFENWTKIEPVRDWAALEKTWATADSGK